MRHFYFINKKSLFILFSIISLIRLYPDATGDLLKKNPFELNRGDNNYFFYVNNTVSVGFNNNFKLLYNRPSDRWYPKSDFMMQGYYTFPINKNIGIGPSIYNQNIFYLSHPELSHDKQSTSINFDTTILAGLSFVFTPVIPSINKPAFLLFIDFGPAGVFNNNSDHSTTINAMIGGYTSQLIILPLMPIHLFIMDMNLIAFVRTDTPAGPMPGIRVRNHFLMKFGFLNFIDKRIKVGLKIKNIFSYILTGRPFTGDLADQFTYNRLFVSLYWNGLKGLELETGYGFEYYTNARESTFHTAHRAYFELSFNRNGFTAGLKHTLSFWSSGIQNGTPINEFEVSFGYRIERI